MKKWLLFGVLAACFVLHAQNTGIAPSNTPFVGPNPWFDVTHYGADPNDVSDSLAAVEAAMTAACATSPSGAVVWFPPGKYTFSNIIPSTSSYWCSGLTIKGSGIRSTELDFPTGSGYAITEAGGTGLGNDIRNLTIEDFLLVVGGGSGGSNNAIGGLFIGNYAFTHEYRNLYIIGPTTSTASGVSTNGDAYVSTIGLDNVRVDNFQGSGGYGFYFAVSGTGDLLRCTFCYANGNNIGMYVAFFWTAVLESSDVDASNNIGFYLQPGNGNTIVGNGLSGEGNTHDLYRIYGNAGATTGGTVILTNPKSSGQVSATSAYFPIDITNFAGDATIINPVTFNTGGSAVASLNISNTPHAVTIVGCDQLLDLGFSSSANTYLGQAQGNTCSNTNGSFGSVALSRPPTPTVTPTCTGTCASTWAYEIVALDANNDLTQASAAGSTAANATTLDSTHYNTVTWTPVAGARYYNVYRTTSGGTPANLSLVCSNLTQGTGLTCKDNGSVNTASVTPSPSNFTGGVTATTYSNLSGNKAVLTSDFTSANSSGLQTITGLVINLPGVSQQVAFSCKLYYSQATQSAGDQFGIASLTTAPQNLRAWASVQTDGAGNAFTATTGDSGNITNTTPTAIATFTPTASGKQIAYIDGSIRTAASGPTALQFYVTNGTAADVIVVGLQSYCVTY